MRQNKLKAICMNNETRHLHPPPRRAAATRASHIIVQQNVEVMSSIWFTVAV